MKKYILLFLAFLTINHVYIALASRTMLSEQETTTGTVGDVIEKPSSEPDPSLEVILDEDLDKAYKIAIASSDLSYEIISSYDSFDNAKEMVTRYDEDHLIIVKDEEIIYVKYGVLNLKTKDFNENTVFYVNGEENYLNGHSAMDALFIDTIGKQYEMEISNARGVVNQSDVKLVPLAYVKSPSYYFLNSFNELVHAISTDIYQMDAYTYSGTIDKAPKYLKQGEKYYSYDGIYFYTNMMDLTLDTREKSTIRAINHEEPFYAYYLYLPLRLLTSYSAADLNSYLKYKLNRLGYDNSVLLNTGQYFLNAQNAYDVNAAYELVWAIHESGFGTSSIAVNKYNLFGLNATDHNPYGNAAQFYSIQAGINYHANTYVNEIYLNTDYYRYSGDYVGNKGSGFNVFYASDPYWGEKIASQYFQLDKYLGFKDYEKYPLVVS